MEIIGNKLLKLTNDNPDKPWEWKWISRNPNITMKIINDNPDKSWEWKWISRNKFKKENEMVILKATIIIQKTFRKYCYDPQYKFCQQVLFNNLRDCGLEI